ncbi:short chain dehydrogenase [Streptomyces sp. 3213]|uniref:SDR family NAD(P)-dependent oxidoreductase n=1 Tax=Streptomyces sp. 3213.3 TaxID=1855348 RepID=UPI0008949CD7|nr:SDR family NAD(P)-dependent oxidoreductase [Streptomyces sp. 3213.3]SEC55245.1 short chain dehydrogenase [Streptomyces sp. 3213] [Streptomyces sp. 3213.3]
MTSIAIVGAGPQLGLAIARTFGSQGYDVALIARNRAKLDDLVGILTAEGISAAAFPSDVLDRDALTQALKDAATQFGGIGVLEYSPSAGLDTIGAATPAGTELAHVQHEIEFRLYGAIAATQAVLPAMREAGAGTLLFTTSTGSTKPQTPTASISTAMAALRSWAINLHKELVDTGIQAAHIGIDATIGTPTFYGQPRATADQLALLYWDLHMNHRDQSERIFRG